MNTCMHSNMQNCIITEYKDKVYYTLLAVAHDTSVDLNTTAQKSITQITRFGLSPN